MKYIKTFEQLNLDIDYIMSDVDIAINHLEKQYPDFFIDHGMEREDALDGAYDALEFFNEYKNKSDVTIYRKINVPSFEDIDLSSVGNFWSFEKDGTGSYDAGVVNSYNKNWNETKDILLTAKINPKSIDWIEVLISNIIYAGDQSECYVKSNSDITITHIDDKKLDKEIKAKS